MPNTVRMIAPAGVSAAVGGAATPPGSGQTYVPDSNGAAYVDPRDVWALLTAGWQLGELPSAVRTIFGSAAPNSPFGAFLEEGNLYRNIAASIGANGADTTDDILGGVQLPAGVFDVLGRGIAITAAGKSGATANAGKGIKLWANPTMAGQTISGGVISGGTVTGAGAGVKLLDSGATAINNKGWQLNGNLFKYGAAGSNTQWFQGSTILDITHGGVILPLLTTLPENAPINLVLTGNSAQSGAADIVLQFLELNAMN
jgi:hypothetical protein